MTNAFVMILLSKQPINLAQLVFSGFRYCFLTLESNRNPVKALLFVNKNPFSFIYRRLKFSVEIISDCIVFIGTVCTRCAKSSDLHILEKQLRHVDRRLHGLAKQADNMQTPVLVLIVMLICPQLHFGQQRIASLIYNNVRDITLVSILSY